MFETLIATVYQKLTKATGEILNGRWWLIKATLIALFCALFFSFPGYREVLRGEINPIWQPVLQKSANPFLDMSLAYGAGSHESKLTFRLTVPLIAHFLNLGIRGMLVLQFIAGVLSLALGASLVYRMTKDRTTAFWAALLLAGTYAGTTAFVEIRGIFDGVAIFFLLAALWFKNPILIGLAVLLAAWTDERGLAAASLVFIFHSLSDNGLSWQGWRAWVKPETIAVVVGGGLYLGSRFLLAELLGLTTSTGGIGLHLLVDQFNQFPMGSWTALEGGWLLVGVALIAFIHHKGYWPAVLFTLSICGIIAISLSVVDITRSMAYMIPAIFIAIKATAAAETPEKTRQYVVLAGLFSILAVNYYTGGEKTIWWQYPLPLQIMRWVFLT